MTETRYTEDGRCRVPASLPPLPEVSLAWEMLREGTATIPEIVEATGIRADAIGYYWRHMVRGEVFDRSQHKWVKPA